MKVLNRKNAGVTSQYPVKILQFGEGNFLRAFADWMVDVMNERIGYNGSVQIIKPRAGGSVKAFNEQDGLFHIVINGIKDQKTFSETRLITAVNEIINPYDDYELFLKTAENPHLEMIISNTTEVGIAFDEQDTSINKLPNRFPGKLAMLLYHRFKYFKGDPGKGLTIIPCELIDKGGEVLKNIVLQYAAVWQLSPEFVSWIEQYMVFCNSLVDRIVPGFPKENAAEVIQKIGYNDRLVVMAEPYHLWVIEPCSPGKIEHVKKQFPGEKAGLEVKVVSDYSPYRTRKVRILNGAHTAMVPVAYLRGLRTVKEAVEDPWMSDFIRKSVFDEIIPTLDMLQDDLIDYAHEVMDRFRNPFIRHELLTISLNSVSKFKIRVLPSIMEFLRKRNTLPGNLLYSLAALIRFYKGEWRGSLIPLNDVPEVMAFMQVAWREGNPEQAVFKVLSNSAFWDQDLTRIPGLSEQVKESLDEIQTMLGAKNT